MNPELKGYCHPLSPEGKAQLIGAPPWHFSAALMCIRYRANPDEVRKLLPEPYELSAVDPGGCYCLFGDWLSVWDDDKDMIVRNPERVQYKELGMGVRCRVNGVEGARCPYCWVDNDFALLRGWFFGYPKKLGRIHLGYSKMKIYELNKGIGKVGPGTRFTSFLEAHGERLITGTMKLSRQISPNELPPPFGLPRFNIIHFPSCLADSSKPLVNQLVARTDPGEPPRYGEIWAADEASLIFNESEIEEHTAIKPIEVTDAYYVEMGQTFAGAKLLQEL